MWWSLQTRLVRAGIISPATRLERYPPFRAMRIRVLDLSPDWRRLRIRLPLNRRNRNPGGSMFGGCIACLADPIAALACARIFPGYAVWTRAMSLDFRCEGRTDLELRFEFDPTTEERVGGELERRGRATPDFEYGFFSQDDRLCALVRNTVAIRAPGDETPSGGALGLRRTRGEPNQRMKQRSQKR